MIMSNYSQQHTPRRVGYLPPSQQKRARVTGDRLAILLSEYLINANPTPETRKLIAAKVGLLERSVRIWFQNRRAKNRKEQREKEQRASAGLDPVNDEGQCIPVRINDAYDFIHSFSVSVGQWLRVLQESGVNAYFVPDLAGLEPSNVDRIMTGPIDLAIVLLRREKALNYFFVLNSGPSQRRVVFRIHYPILLVYQVLSMPLVAAHSQASDYTRNPHNSELTLHLNRPPLFALYFPDGQVDSWTVLDDFSIDQLVRDCYKGPDGSGNGIPHKITGRNEAIRHLEEYIRKEIGLDSVLLLPPAPYLPSFYGFPASFEPGHSHTPSNSLLYLLALPAQTPTLATVPDFYGFNTPVYQSLSVPPSTSESLTYKRSPAPALAPMLQPPLQARQPFFGMPIPQHDFFYEDSLRPQSMAGPPLLAPEPKTDSEKPGFFEKEQAFERKLG